MVTYERPWTIDPSAAQAHPNGRGEINAFVPDLALRRAALKGATSSPNGGDVNEIKHGHCSVDCRCSA